MTDEISKQREAFDRALNTRMSRKYCPNYTTLKTML